MGPKRRFFLSGCVALLLGIGVATATTGVVPEALYDKAAREGSVRVIVQFRATTTPEGKLQSVAAVASQRQYIAAMRYAALAELAGTSYRTIREFATIPFVALEVAPEALSVLEVLPTVVGVEEDRLESASLSQSVPLIGADQAWAAGFDGTGIVVAILDTGVDKTHPFLSGKVVEEACYSNSGNCPNGLDSQTESGAGVPCTYAANGCQHGTHVAGIAAGSGASAGVSFSGVAKGASIMAVQVFSRFTGASCADEGEDPCTLTFISDQVKGLEQVFLLSTQHTIAAVNMSLGGSKFTSPCDSSQAARKAAIDNLRSVGIATVIASGNDGFTDGLSAPACISTAVSVGSTTKSDAVSSFSNSATFLSLLAPGSSINSSVPGGGFAFFSGTSMAAPHVTGAWAILKQAKPSATVNEVLTALRNTGLLITDPRNNVTTPRIRVDQALQAITTSHSLTITSGPSGSPNPVASGGTASLSVSATDSLGHGLSYAWTASCSTLGSNGSFNNATLQTPAWTAPVNATGSQRSCTMQVTVSDGQGLSQVGSYAQGVATIPGLPDLVPSINPISSTGTLGGTIQVSASVVNQGAISAGAFRLGVYFSSNTTIATGDVLFATCNPSGLAPGATTTCSGPVTIPTSLSPGVYFVGVIADDQDAVAETNEDNNTAAAGPITVLANTPVLPDLVPSINPISSTGTVGGTIQLSASVVNQGAGAAGAFRLGVYFSSDATITTADVLFANCNTFGLAPGATTTCSGPVTIPTSLSPGVYFVGVIADDQGTVGESNETNNTALTGPITVSPAQPPSAAIALNGSVFRTGQTIIYQATLTPGSPPAQMDIYLVALLPDGVTFLSLVESSPGVITFALAPSPIPLFVNVTLTPLVVPFSYTFLGAEPVGTYITHAILAVAGSNPLQFENQLSLAVQPFQFIP